MTRRELVGVLAGRIASIARPHPVRVGIDGIDASGKTTLADEVAEAIAATGRQVIRASIDGFHNPAEVRRKRGVMSAEGYFHDSFNYASLVEVLLQPLGPGGSATFKRKVFDVRADKPVDAPLEHAAPASILVFDGVFLLRPGLRDHFDVSIFLRVGFDITLARAEQRDRHLFGSIEELRDRYARRYQPGQKLYLATADPESRATIVVDNDDPQNPVLERA